MQKSCEKEKKIIVVAFCCKNSSKRSRGVECAFERFGVAIQKSCEKEKILSTILLLLCLMILILKKLVLKEKNCVIWILIQ